MFDKNKKTSENRTNEQKQKDKYGNKIPTKMNQDKDENQQRPNARSEGRQN